MSMLRKMSRTGIDEGGLAKKCDIMEVLWEIGKKRNQKRAVD